ncbi:uncharacterized protein [Physcomitrium patens]|uniref:Uncharacterized protein n=1 Tax=Physcomitrium patens TaxID=3218 RepID=A0A7I4C766_PHYPA
MIGFSIGVNFASATGGGCGLGCALKKTGKSEVRCFCCTSTVDGYISAPVVFPVLFSSCRVSPRPFALRVPRTWNSHVNWYCRSSSTWLEDERARGEVENHPVVVWRLFHGHFLALVSFVDAKEVVTGLLCGGRGRGRRSQLSSVELMWQREREWCVVEKQVKPVKILVGDVESMQRLVGKRKSLRMGGV